MANRGNLRDTAGTPILYTPHDFRRIFITTIGNAGFPIHLAAKLVGHNDIEVAQGYTAGYQKDVFEPTNDSSPTADLPDPRG